MGEGLRQRLDQRLREIIALHFDSKEGTPYWLEQVGKLGFDPRERIRSIDDLWLLGPMDQGSIGARPVLDYVPASIAARPDELIIAQTGGTSGRPVWTVYTPDDFHAAFVAPFVAAAQHVGFPTGGQWLYAGPTGPHVIGRAAEAIARARGGLPPFSVDFDPRWAGKLQRGSFAAERYVQHLVEQALAIIERQRIEIIFATPLLLRALADAMTQQQRIAIRGVHYGGMAIESNDLRRFQTELFPKAVHLSGYGNTLFGCCLELSAAAGRSLRYFPHGERLLLGVLDEHDSKPARPRWDCTSAVGRLTFTRLDRSCFLANVVERDRAQLCLSPDGAPAGFALPGVESPAPLEPRGTRPTAALY